MYPLYPRGFQACVRGFPNPLCPVAARAGGDAKLLRTEYSISELREGADNVSDRLTYTSGALSDCNDRGCPGGARMSA